MAFKWTVTATIDGDEYIKIGTYKDGITAQAAGVNYLQQAYDDTQFNTWGDMVELVALDDYGNVHALYECPIRYSERQFHFYKAFDLTKG